MQQFRNYLDAAFGRENWFKAEDLFDREVERVRGKSGVRFVELGTHLGRSACYMAEAILGAHLQASVVTVDIFADPAVETQARANLEPYVRAGFLTVQKADSAGFAAAFPHDVDFVFIDANHGYERVKADIEAWWPKVKSGGIIAGDDLWWRQTDARPWVGPYFPVWRAVEASPIGGDYEVTVRKGWAMWWKGKP